MCTPKQVSRGCPGTPPTLGLPCGMPPAAEPVLFHFHLCMKSSCWRWAEGAQSPSRLLPRRLRGGWGGAPGTSQAATWSKPPVPHLGVGGDWRGPLPHPHCVLPASPPEPGLAAYCSHPSLGGHLGSPTDACKVSLARGAARTQAPRWRRGQRCLGPPRQSHSHPFRARTSGAHSPSSCCWPRGPGGVQRALVVASTATRIGTGGARPAAR